MLDVVPFTSFRVTKKGPPVAREPPVRRLSPGYDPSSTVNSVSMNTPLEAKH